MKKPLAFWGALFLCLCLCACTAQGASENSTTSDPNQENVQTTDDALPDSEALSTDPIEDTSSPLPEGEVENRKLKLTLDSQEITITLYDTPAADALYEMLPLDLTFEDFNGVEKISYLEESLPTEGEPDGCDPDVGDLCLYAPWGNLSIFYQDYRYSQSLIQLGHVDSGMDLISSMREGSSATLDKAQ